MDALVGPHWATLVFLGHTGPKLAIVYWPAAPASDASSFFRKDLMMITTMITAVIILKLIIIIIAKIVVAGKDLKMVGR